MRFKPVLFIALFSMLSAPLALAQQPDGGSSAPPPPSRMGPGGSSSGRMGGGSRGDMSGRGMGFGIAPMGMWWKNPDLVQKLALTPDQQKRMDDIFQKSRLDLIDLKASLEKQELLMQPMLAENPPDTNKVLAQIDHVAQARAELEKGNARMLLGIRGVLTPDQWTKLQDADRENRGRMRRFGGSDNHGQLQGPDTTGNSPAPAM